MGRVLIVQTHALLRIEGPGALCADTAIPAWVTERATRVPWVVVRRARSRNGLIPVGVRGGSRAERFAAWLQPGEVRECLTPQALAARRGWHAHARRSEVPALAALDEIESLMIRVSLATCWGPSGSVAFELASGSPAATAASDADLIVLLDARLAPGIAPALLRQLARLPVRTDPLLELPRGALALAEYVHGRPPYLVRTPEGPRLLEDPWADAVAAA